MELVGGCHCGAIRYEVAGDPLTHALCHCSDCRRHAGAPMGGWTMYPEAALRVTKGVPARVHIQVAERIRWMESAHEMPA